MPHDVNPLLFQRSDITSLPVSQHLGDLRVTARDAIGVRIYNSAAFSFGWLTYRIYFPTLDIVRDYIVRVPAVGNLGTNRLEEFREESFETRFRLEFSSSFGVSFYDTYGYLTDVTLYFSEGLTTDGATFAQCYVRRWSGIEAISGAFDRAVRGLIIRVLFQGYLQTFGFLSWPPGIFNSPFSGPGRLRSISGTDPAANTEINETVPTNAHWRLLLLRTILTTDGTAATREVGLVIDDGTLVFSIYPPAQTQTASLTRAYNWAHLGYAPAAFGAQLYGPLPADLMLLQSWRLRTITQNIQAGDNWEPPQLLVEEWIGEL